MIRLLECCLRHTPHVTTKHGIHVLIGYLLLLVLLVRDMGRKRPHILCRKPSETPAGHACVLLTTHRHSRAIPSMQPGGGYGVALMRELQLAQLLLLRIELLLLLLQGLLHMASLVLLMGHDKLPLDSRLDKLRRGEPLVPHLHTGEWGHDGISF